MTGRGFSDDDVIVEFQRIGNSVKVTAVDARTGTEASIVGPASAGEATLTQNAVRKLAYVLQKQAQQ